MGMHLSGKPFETNSAVILNIEHKVMGLNPPPPFFEHYKKLQNWFQEASLNEPMGINMYEYMALLKVLQDG